MLTSTGGPLPSPIPVITIPVCDEIIEALRSAILKQKVKVPSGEMFVNSRGNLWDVTLLSHRWSVLLKRATLGRLTIKKLRSSFVTMAGRLGVSDRILKAYIGQSAGDVLGCHYRRIDLDELRLVSDAMNGWRTLSDRKETGNITTARSVNDSRY
jgi:hypothetical protein